MTDIDRRTLLASLGAVGIAGAFAGCLDESAGGDTGSGPSGSHEYVRTESVVDYPAMVDGAATVSGDERTITYENPETTFAFQYAYEGDSDDPSELRVSRDLSGETMAAFVAPVYDEAAGAFVYHVFANDAFVAHGDWYYVAGPSTDPTDTGPAAFESLTDGVSRTVVGPVEATTAGVIDAPFEEAQGGGGDLTGVILAAESGGGSSPDVPQVAWGFDYDRDAGALEITHEGGDTVRSGDLVVLVETDDQRTLQPFDGDVSAGDRATVEIQPNATVSVVWGTRDGEQRSVLARWEGPDA